MSKSTARLDYDRLVREYLDNLNVNLRGFHPAEQFDFLAAWVPNDDPTAGIVELVELAREGALTWLSINLGPDTAGRIDWEQVRAGAGEFTQHQEGTNTVVEFALAADDALEIHPCYVAALKGLLGDIRHEAALSAPPDQDLIEVTEDGVTLTTLVERKRRTATRAAFRGAASPTQRALLEGLCRVLEQKPIQECADHAVITLESDLRASQLPPPVPGLVTPENADPAFGLPQRLVRALRAACQTQTGHADTRNFYERPLAKAWAALTDAQRCDALRGALTSQGAADHVQLVGMDGPRRAVVRMADGLDSATCQELLVRLEAHVRTAIEPAVQLVCQTKLDKNLLRQPDRRNPS
jgi:hypothetical protein